MINFFKNKYFLTISTLLLLLSTSHTLSHSNINENKSNYIIRFFDNAKLNNEINDNKRRGIKVNHILDSIFKGYIGEMTKTQAQQLLKNPNIEFVELDAKITTFTQQINATWGLDRVDQSKLPLDSNYNYISDGKGVNLYVNRLLYLNPNSKDKIL
jgi:hypothetical protein